MTAEERFEQIERGHELQQKNLAELTEAIASYAANADARMKRIEENLDALIRAITMEHSNGKGKL